MCYQHAEIIPKFVLILQRQDMSLHCVLFGSIGKDLNTDAVQGYIKYQRGHDHQHIQYGYTKGFAIARIFDRALDHYIFKIDTKNDG
jgi:hypothetical protein